MQIDTIITAESTLDFVKTLLTDKKRYSLYTDKVKTSNFFMTQRFIAKAYPIVAQHSNVNGINQVAILDFYHSKLCKDGSVPPRWLYTSGKKADVDAMTKEERLLHEMHSNTSALLILLAVLDIDYKSLNKVIELDYVYIQQTWSDTLEQLAGRVKNKRKRN